MSAAFTYRSRFVLALVAAVTALTTVVVWLGATEAGKRRLLTQMEGR